MKWTELENLLIAKQESIKMNIETYKFAVKFAREQTETYDKASVAANFFVSFGKLCETLLKQTEEMNKKYMEAYEQAKVMGHRYREIIEEQKEIGSKVSDIIQMLGE